MKSLRQEKDLLTSILEAAEFPRIDPKKINHEKLAGAHLVMKVAEVSECLRISHEMVRFLIEQGELAAIDISLGSRRHYRVPKEELIDFLKRKGVAK